MFAGKANASQPVGERRRSGSLTLEGHYWPPIPREQLLEPGDRGVGDTSKNVGEPCLWIDVIELSARDQRCHEGSAIGTTIGAGEEPCLSAESEATQRPFGGIVRQANPPVAEEGREAVPALQHVIDRLGDR